MDREYIIEEAYEKLWGGDSAESLTHKMRHALIDLAVDTIDEEEYEDDDEIIDEVLDLVRDFISTEADCIC